MSRGATLFALLVAFVFLAGCAQFGPSGGDGSAKTATDTMKPPTTSSRTSSPTFFTASTTPSSSPSSTSASPTTNSTSNTTSPSPGTNATSPSTSPSGTTNATGNGTHIHIAKGAYDPKTLTVKKGVEVVWHGHEAGHTVTIHDASDPPTTTIFDKTVAVNQTVTYKFEAAGTYNVYCKNHSNGELGQYGAGMTGTITVN